MLDTILIDLDGTLLSMWQDDFVSTYFKELTKKLAPLGIEPQAAIDALWKGTAAMVKNDGSVMNCVRFWESFSQNTGLEGQRLARVKAVCDSFYSNEFNKTKVILADTDGAPEKIVRGLGSKGYRVVLATNPIFPPQAVTSRLGWIGLEDRDFALTTDYENTGFCKPNLDYYRNVLARVGATPDRCMMIGNSVKEDMCAAQLGMDTYFVTGYEEGADGVDISHWKHGTLAQLAQYVAAMPDIAASV